MHTTGNFPSKPIADCQLLLLKAYASETYQAIQIHATEVFRYITGVKAAII